MKDRKYNLGLPKQRQNRYLLGTDGVIADLPSGLSSGFLKNFAISKLCELKIMYDGYSYPYL